MSALLPCPFCGENAVEVFRSKVFGGWTIECSDCQTLSLSGIKKAEAIAAWNRRTPPPLPTREEVAAVIHETLDRVTCPPKCEHPDCHCFGTAADAVLRLLGGEW